MTINWDSSEGLFTRLGKIGNILNIINTHRGTTIVADFGELEDEYDSDRDLATTFTTDLANVQSGPNGALGSLKSAAERTVIKMVKADNRQPDDTLQTALIEVIRQMNANSESIDANTVSGAATAGGSNHGDGVMNVSVLSTKGKTLEMCLAETLTFTCVNDSQNNGTSVGQESFQGKGELIESDKFSWNWPQGSGAGVSLNAVPSTLDASSNLLTNADFEDITANVPDKWAVVAGVAGTDFGEEASVVYQGAKAFKLIGTGTDQKIVQAFGDSTLGTASSLEPLTVYHGCVWARVSTAATGTLTIRLYNVTGAAVIADDAANSQSVSIDISTLSTGYVAQRFSFRTPRTLPAASRLEILGTTVESGKTVYLDNLTLCKPTQIYDSGPYVSVHAGATAFSRDDSHSVVISNNYASEFGALLERLFDLNQKKLQIPTDSGGTETIADSLIA